MHLFMILPITMNWGDDDDDKVDDDKDDGSLE